ncbi:MAG: NAD(P)/FAD-dependent oxidoreductase [Phycisphaerae bacterium]
MPTALVIGGGPAGCVAAVALARAGWGVTLVEQKPFPRDKVCGECLSTTAVGVLRRLDLAARLEPQAVRFTAALLHPRTGRSLRLPLPHEMWGISRHAMDLALVEAAAEAGVTLLQPARCTAVRPGTASSPPAVDVTRLPTREVTTLTADAVLTADGTGTTAGTAGRPTGDFGLKAHFRLAELESTAIHLFGVEGSYGGVAAVEGGRFNLAFSVPAKRLKAVRGDLDALFQQLCSENNHLAAAMKLAERTGDWHACPLPRFAPPSAWPAGVWPVGNAAAALEPIAGEGMGLAMRSAELAATYLAAGRSPAELHAAYVRLWRRKRLLTRVAALLLSRRRSAWLALPLLRVPGLGRLGLRAVGK